jgi:glycosyltransferase involved in cell wall biosynthesis
MRVLVIATELHPYGGTQSFLERVLEIHARRGIKTSLLAPEGETPQALADLVRLHRIEFIRARYRGSADTASWLTPWHDFKYCWGALRSCRPDLVLVSTADPGRMSVALYLPWPVLYVLHSVPEHRFSLPARLFLRGGARLENMVVAVSKAAASELCTTMGLDRDRISVLYNSCRSFGAPGHAAAEPVILTAGHAVQYKNPWLWLEVARSVLRGHPTAKFVWLGDGPLLEPLRRKVQELSLQESVLLPGHVEDPAPWYARAAIYFQPSLRESHGIAVLEAMACALPCVVADSGGLPESVLDGDTGFVRAACDAAGFADSILQLLHDPVLGQEMGNKGRERVGQHFSRAGQEEKLLSLYRSITEKSPDRRGTDD